MKKYTYLILLVFLCAFFSSSFAEAASAPISVQLDGKLVKFDVPPQILYNRTLVPFRAVAEALNVKVTWDSKEKSVTAQSSSSTIKLIIGSKTAYKNGTATSLDVPAAVLNGRTLIPLRFFSEAFGCEVFWDSSAKLIRITSQAKNLNVLGFYAHGDSWINLFQTKYPEAGKGNTDKVNELSFGWYQIDRDGNFIPKDKTEWHKPDGWENLFDALKFYSLKTEMMIYITDGKGDLTALLDNPESCKNAVDNIVQEAQSFGGVNLDFEGLGLSGNEKKLANIKNSFNQFVNQLAQKLKADKLPLTLTLHPPNGAFRGYDYKALGEIADRIIIMAYEYGNKPEPESLVTQAVEMAIKQVPADKLLLGISIPNETPESLPKKIAIAKQYQLNGIALWRVGTISDEMWNALGNVLQKK
ncbi:MAG: stalk domain-containing protein [Clostridia bacterium]|nr:stalk domain-containing protein [Clostridia bacterium]